MSVIDRKGPPFGKGPKTVYNRSRPFSWLRYSETLRNGVPIERRLYKILPQSDQRAPAPCVGADVR